MKVEDFKGKSPEELVEFLQSDLDAWKEKVDAINDVDELKNLENGLDEDEKDFDEYLRTAEYDLPETVDFEGKTYKAREIANKIVYHLNRVEVEFKASLGMHDLVKYWKQDNHSKISYGVYDSTSRTLNTLRFKGDNEWVDILSIYTYLATAQEGYMTACSGQLYFAQKRNCVVNRLQMVSPVEPDQTTV